MTSKSAFEISSDQKVHLVSAANKIGKFSWPVSNLQVQLFIVSILITEDWSLQPWLVVGLWPVAVTLWGPRYRRSLVAVLLRKKQVSTLRTLQTFAIWCRARAGRIFSKGFCNSREYWDFGLWRLNLFCSGWGWGERMIIFQVWLNENFQLVLKSGCWPTL